MGPWLIILSTIGILIGAATVGVIPNKADPNLTQPAASVEKVKAPEVSASPSESPAASQTATPTPTPELTPTPKPSLEPVIKSVVKPTPSIKITTTPAPVQNDGLSNDNTYTNSAGNEVHSPAYSNTIPAGATAICGDGTYSFSQSRRGTCSHHGGVSQWL